MENEPTPTDRAGMEAWLDDWFKRTGNLPKSSHDWPTPATCFLAGVLAERERAAKVAEAQQGRSHVGPLHEMGWNGAASLIAAAIRRGPPASPDPVPFDGTYPLPADRGKAGYKNPPPPGSGDPT